MKVRSKRVLGKKPVFEIARVASAALLLAGGAIGAGGFGLPHAGWAQCQLNKQSQQVGTETNSAVGV